MDKTSKTPSLAVLQGVDIPRLLVLVFLSPGFGRSM